MGYARCNVKPTIEGILDPPENWQIPEDAQSSKAVIFNFEYQWEGKNCTIKNLSWYPVVYIQEPEQEPVLSSTTFVNTEFTQIGQLSIKFGNTDAAGISGNINQLNRTSSQIITNTTTIPNVEAKYLVATFRYIYTVSTEGKSDIDYIVEIKNIKIPKTSKYENNVIFTEEGVKSLLTQIKEYPIIDIETVASDAHDPSTSTSNNDIIWTKYTDGKPCIKIKYGNTEKTFGSGTTQTTGYKYVAVGSNITFPNGTIPLPSTPQATGTVRITIDGVTHEIPVYGLSGTGSGGISLSGTTTVAGHLLPGANNSYDIGQPDDPNTESNEAKIWRNLYATNGYFTSLTVNGNLINAADLNEVVNGALANRTTVFWRGDGSWSNELQGPLSITSSNAYLKLSNKNSSTSGALSAGRLDLRYSSTYGNYFCVGRDKDNPATGEWDVNFWAAKVFNAVFNDYAEYRTTIVAEPGQCVIDNDDGSLSITTTRLQPGAQIISDTFGHAMGYNETCKTPLAVAGRVLVYTFQDRNKYHAGMSVCSAPGGTVDIMSREEIKEYPDCIVGIVSEIPQYDTWGTDNIKVDGRIWIKVK